MKIAFYTNFLTHHQLPFCLEMYKKYGNDFIFVSTEKINEERLSLGYRDMDNDYPFVLKAYENNETFKEALKLAIDADVAIIGSTTSDIYAKERLKQDKLTFRYYARIFYTGVFSIFDFKNLKKVYERHFKYRKNKNLYLLCASGYGPNDFNKLGMYIDKCFKWGYFPGHKEYNIDTLMKEKDKRTVIWVGRFVKEKHPEYVIKLAKILKKQKNNISIKMVGNGKLFNRIQKQIKRYNLDEQIELVGAVESNRVRDYMEKASIFIFTSDKKERWGAVLYEAMNSGCAVLANKYIGAVPFLVKDNENGLIYSNYKEYYKKLKQLLNNENEQKRLGINAYKTIQHMWVEENAVNNLESLLKSIINKKENPIKEGPASNAYPVKK